MCFTPFQFDTLLDSIPLLEHANKLVDLDGIGERLGDALPLHAPLPPSNQLRGFLLDAEVGAGLIRVEPSNKGHKGNVNKPK